MTFLLMVVCIVIGILVGAGFAILNGWASATEPVKPSGQPKVLVWQVIDLPPHAISLDAAMTMAVDEWLRTPVRGIGMAVVPESGVKVVENAIRFHQVPLELLSGRWVW